jgi:hypothetical protein
MFGDGCKAELHEVTYAGTAKRLDGLVGDPKGSVLIFDRVATVRNTFKARPKQRDAGLYALANPLRETICKGYGRQSHEDTHREQTEHSKLHGHASLQVHRMMARRMMAANQGIRSY